MNKYFSGFKKKFFQGWYFKQSAAFGESIAVIPGYAVSGEGGKTAFIHVLTGQGSSFNEYPIEDFHANADKLEIKIGDSTFSEEGVKLDIGGGIRVKGEVSFSRFNPPLCKFLSPNIMGPFDFFPFMECNHHIYSLHHTVGGVVSVDNKEIIFNGGRGYCEGDRGMSFPKSYIWLQSNSFGADDSCISLSIADVPFLGMVFCGFIAVFKYEGREYRFATYNGAKIALLEDRGDTVYIVLTRFGNILEAALTLPVGFDLKAPQNGVMKNTVKETHSASLNLKVTADKKIIFDESGIICSAENVGKVRCMSRAPVTAKTAFSQ
jgi:hypothetical protein